MEENSDYIKRRFNCKVCKTTHTITLNKNLCDGKTRYPFTHVYLYGDLKEILTILHIDKDLQIRAADTEVLSMENIFSKEQVVEIVGKLVDEIEALRDDYNNLFTKFQDLQENTEESSGNKFFNFIKSVGEDIVELVKNIFITESSEQEKKD